MLYFKIADKQVIDIKESYPQECHDNPASWARQRDGRWGDGWLSRGDLAECPAGWVVAQELAASASKFSGWKFIATDAGEQVWPRYDVIKAPVVGDEVSKAFNGDYYPVGKIIKIGKNYGRIYVTGGEGELVFYRRKLTGAWLLNKTWGLVPGSITRRNPEF